MLDIKPGLVYTVTGPICSDMVAGFKMSKKKTDTDIFPEMTFIHYGDKDPTPEDIVEVYQSAVAEKLQRQRDKSLKKLREIDQEAQIHENVGPLMQLLIGGTLGGLGTLAVNRLRSGEPLTNREKVQSLIPGAVIGAAATMAVPHLMGTFMGQFKRKPWQNHVEYIIGDNAWKNYLIPGYAGYRDTIRRRLVKEMIGE